MRFVFWESRLLDHWAESIHYGPPLSDHQHLRTVGAYRPKESLQKPQAGIRAWEEILQILEVTDFCYNTSFISFTGQQNFKNITPMVRECRQRISLPRISKFSCMSNAYYSGNQNVNITLIPSEINF